MNTKHTPGPWIYDDCWSLIHGPKGEEIAAIHSAQSNPKRCDKGITQANARLIASAPELLDACEMLANYYDHALPDGAWTRTPMWGILAAARAAISKAMGKE